MTKPDVATARQIVAANPDVSTWLSANAGSGKTRVLTDRVARLLLEGVSPQNILCLTYTKAAASEMQNRLFKRLGEWAMKDDADLTAELSELGARVPDDLTKARTLFARAIETPGGLRIQTIHSFCSSLLRRFPLEAGVSPMFVEMDERAAKILRDDIIDAIARGAHSQALKDLAFHYSGEDFSKLTQEVVRHKSVFGQGTSQSEVWAEFGLRAGYDVQDLIKSVFLGSEESMIASLIPVLRASDKSTDQKNADKLSAAKLSNPSVSVMLELASVFLSGKTAKAGPYSAKLDSFPTKSVRDAHPDLMEKVQSLMLRVEEGRRSYARLLAAEKSLVLHRFAQELLSSYETRKAATARLDFDDLIGHTGRLLSNPEVAQWVLYRLDGGIDHILVDEAQDTSPEQWRVIELLAQEFGAGVGARGDLTRTIFVVGDLKQSIFSFQGADPKEFDRMRRHFSESLGGSGQSMHDRSLDHSFRSSPAILDLVDATFKDRLRDGAGETAVHLPFHQNLPGRVDLWPVVVEGDAPVEKEWFDPSDRVAQSNHRTELANHVADCIHDLIECESIPDENGGFRPVVAGDFLVLVQRRSELFHEIIAACKNRKLPIAGADRLKIAGELAVKDLTALLNFLALPEDDLSLAACLRSPIFGVSESELYSLAHGRGRKETLWAALFRDQTRFPEVVELLVDLRNQVDFLLPYDLLERALTRFGRRERLLARLGPEAEDGIDAILSLAVQYEKSQTPSLTGFLVWLAAEDVELKRQTDNAGGRIRVMTTHGAKGLESPIVILPDTGDRRVGRQNEIVLSKSGFAMWKTGADFLPEQLESALENGKTAEQEERDRLLYVALTRAENWLIVCASGNISDKSVSWYRQVETGLSSLETEDVVTLAGPGRRYSTGVWESAAERLAPETTRIAAAIPDWVNSIPPTPERALPAISPSSLEGAKALLSEIAEDSNFDAMKRGSQIHLLLEHLPGRDAADWPKTAHTLLSSGEFAGDASEINDALAEASRVLANPVLEPIFAKEALAEVTVSANLSTAGSDRIRGTIDRLIVSDSTIHIVDFKSNRVIPAHPDEVPIGILRQMAAYLLAIEQVYPSRDVRLSILWTANATLMGLPHDIVRASMESLLHLDVPTPET